MISVIIPSYNSAQYVGQAVKSALNQTIQEEVEVIVIDDASGDHTQEAVKEISATMAKRSLIYCRNEKNLGVAETRNKGIRMAKGEYIAFLDADDWWDLEKLDMQADLIKKRDCPFVFSGRELMDANGEPTGKIIDVPNSASYKTLLLTNCVPCSSVLMKTSVAREFYMSHDELHEDYIMWLRVLKKYGEAFAVKKPLLKSRLSEGGKSRNKLESAKMHYKVYRLMGIPAWKSIWFFLCYAVNGVRKYY
ncbi:MAG: glycosyltransferase family 2 protein [Eubacterium sp.]|jgi:teichuronic acid biosynthesis glycosyltransferase TuaG|nr:glycosyltransferase family 2 protein [Eubacterium sp.]